MFRTVKEGVEGLVEATGLNQEEEEAAAVGEVTGDGSDDVAADIDARAQTGDLTFNDFLTLSSAYAKLGGKQVPGMPEMSASQLLETREKFERHEKIVETMLDEERADPELLLEDLKSGGSTPGPRIQRIAQASGEKETEVALFLMQFEGMRESTKRIAAGEDPDEVTASMGAPPGANRSARRAAKKKAAKKKTKK